MTEQAEWPGGDDARAEQVLTGLDPEQREAASAVRGPVCILAGAGTGKTRAITHRIAYAVRTGAVPAGQLLAVTFTARAAGELRGRLRALGAGGVQARTFHAAALRQLQYFAPQILGGGMPDVLDNQHRVVANAAARIRLKVDRTEVRDLAAEIDWAKSVLATPEGYPAKAREAGRETTSTPATIAALYTEYEATKRRMQQIDFADLLLIMSAGMEQNPTVAEEIRSRYRHFVVDEYQDVSPLQQKLLDAWLGDRTDLCVVGDPNQTIYSFAGATPKHLLEFKRRFSDAVQVELHRDYRSTPQVVELANSLVLGERGVKLSGQRPDGPAPTFAEFDDEPAEAADVADRCKRLIDGGTPAAEIAILFRVNAQSEVYEAALTRVGVPYVLRGGERFFDRPEIREARLLLRGAARSGEDTDAALPDAVRGVIASLGWYPDNAPPGGAQRERWESLAALVTLADDVLAADPDAHLDEFTTELDQRAGAQHAPTVQGVTLASLHSAKGLEWDAVFLVGLTDTTLPIQHATTPAQVAEERRLLYVGITRARESLALSWALARSAGQRRNRRPSRFLDGLRPAGTASTPVAKKKSRRDKAEAADAELFGRLRAWRKAQAEAQSVPPYVVFSDATLVAIADSHPKSRAGLAQISGVGPTKLTRYADPILAVLGGADPAEVDPVEVA